LLLCFVLFLSCEATIVNSPPTFDKNTSYRFVYYAYSAYNTPAVGKWDCHYCTNFTTGFVVTANCEDKAKGSFAFVGYHPTYAEIVVSFRGSNDIPNWIEDIDAIKTRPGRAFPGIPDAQVEDGFYIYYESLKDCVTAEMQNLKKKYSSYQLRTTGHSLGAAGAALCAMDLMVNANIGNVQCYNFGEPRLGNPAYANASMQYLPGLQRMVDYRDCVPKLPPAFLGYQHEAYEIFESPEGGDTYQICDASGEDPTCSDSLPSQCRDHMHYMGVFLDPYTN